MRARAHPDRCVSGGRRRTPFLAVPRLRARPCAPRVEVGGRSAMQAFCVCARLSPSASCLLVRSAAIFDSACGGERGGERGGVTGRISTAPRLLRQAGSVRLRAQP